MDIPLDREGLDLELLLEDDFDDGAKFHETLLVFSVEVYNSALAPLQVDHEYSPFLIDENEDQEIPAVVIVLLFKFSAELEILWVDPESVKKISLRSVECEKLHDKKLPLSKFFEGHNCTQVF